MNVYFNLPTFTFATTLTALACTASVLAQEAESESASDNTTTMLITPPGRVELPNDEVPPMEIVEQPVEDILYRIGELTGKTNLPWATSDPRSSRSSPIAPCHAARRWI